MQPPSSPARVLCAVMAAVSIPMALVIPLWITAGRMAFGVDGHLVPIFAVTAGPVLAILMLTAAIRITVNAAARRPFGAPLKTSFLLLGNYVLAGAFGFFVPDFGEDGSGSVFSAVAGNDVLGYSAALANPFGIATLLVAVIVLVRAFREPAAAMAASR
ncbi:MULTISPECIES: hypothetical protein [Arthrobacter]|uniref:hypothetical protein n=1 Tax=Arthrobacter TaxID=1663 RepID=UPI001D13B76C|nr:MULTISPECIES: hypothetical protein [Arthrobacter]MCC3282903.1 hypothetical protein [Arthrobacter caoxuetaonis]MCC9192168.1 hypothetical protein [Arthrobacter sp. zg-Y916]